MSALFGTPHLPPRLRRFVLIALIFSGVSVLVFVAVVLSAWSPSLRGLTFGYEISPVAGVFFAACGASLLVDAKTEIDDWEEQQGAPRRVYV